VLGAEVDGVHVRPGVLASWRPGDLEAWAGAAAGNHDARTFARTFAREGARVFLAGRTAAKLGAVAKDIEAAGGRAHPAVVDALSEGAAEEHADVVPAQARSIDVSLNLITRKRRTGHTAGGHVGDATPPQSSAANSAAR
jgi:short subunit dehydrogenase